MERKIGYPDYTVWLHEKDPEKIKLRSRYVELICKINTYRSEIKRVPMPAELDDIYLSRSSSHINQSLAVSVFMENLLYNFMREESDENLNLLFAFLENYAALLEQEWKYCNM